MKSKSLRPFNVQVFLDSAGISKKVVAYRRAETIFSQGDVCDSVMYIQKGGVKLSGARQGGQRGSRRDAGAW